MTGAAMTGGDSAPHPEGHGAEGPGASLRAIVAARRIPSHLVETRVAVAGRSASRRGVVGGMTVLVAALVAGGLLAGLTSTARATTFAFGAGVRGLDRGIRCCSMSFWVPARAAFLREPAGTLRLHDVGTGGDVRAYCIGIAPLLRYGTTFDDGARTDPRIARILAVRFPSAAPLLAADAEAAAVQIAIWSFSDGVPLAGRRAPRGVPAAVLARARVIAADGAAHPVELSSPLLTVEAPATGLAVGTPARVVIRVAGPGGTGMAGATVSVAATAASLGDDGSASAVTVTTGPAGVVSIPVLPGAPGALTLSAETTIPVDGGRELLPRDGGQALVLATRFPLVSRTRLALEVAGRPAPGLTKVVTDLDTGATGTTIGSRPGDRLRFTMTAVNTGTAVLRGAGIVDDPGGLAGVADNLTSAGAQVAPAGSAPPAVNGGLVRWTVGDLEPGSSVVITLDARVRSGLTGATSGCNRASLVAAGSTPVAAPPACVRVEGPSGVAVAKVVDGMADERASGERLGTPVRWTLTVRNRGALPLGAVAVSDRMSDGITGLVTDIALQAPPGWAATWSAAERLARWSGSLPGGAVMTLVVSGTLPRHLAHGIDTCGANAAAALVAGVTTVSPPSRLCLHPAPCPRVLPLLRLEGATGTLPDRPVPLVLTVANAGGTALVADGLHLTAPDGATWVLLPPGARVDGPTAWFAPERLLPGQQARLSAAYRAPAAGGPLRASAAAAARDASGAPDCGGATAAVAGVTTSLVAPPGGEQPPGGIIAATTPIVGAPHTGAAPAADPRRLATGGGLIVAGGGLVWLGATAPRGDRRRRRAASRRWP